MILLAWMCSCPLRCPLATKQSGPCSFLSKIFPSTLPRPFFPKKTRQKSPSWLWARLKAGIEFPGSFLDAFTHHNQPAPIPIINIQSDKIGKCIKLAMYIYGCSTKFFALQMVWFNAIPRGINLSGVSMFSRLSQKDQIFFKKKPTIKENQQLTSQFSLNVFNYGSWKIGPEQNPP